MKEIYTQQQQRNTTNGVHRRAVPKIAIFGRHVAPCDTYPSSVDSIVEVIVIQRMLSRVGKDFYWITGAVCIGF